MSPIPDIAKMTKMLPDEILMLILTFVVVSSTHSYIDSGPALIFFRQQLSSNVIHYNKRLRDVGLCVL